jgi:hypothetical protein
MIFFHKHRAFEEAWTAGPALATKKIEFASNGGRGPEGGKDNKEFLAGGSQQDDGAASRAFTLVGVPSLLLFSFFLLFFTTRGEQFYN